MIIVTGGAGLIGSNIVRALNNRGITDILVVDSLQDGRKIRNMADLDFVDYFDRDDFARVLSEGRFPDAVEVVFHQGARSATTDWDGRFLMKNNFEFSRDLALSCRKTGTRLIYASSASVYGLGAKGFVEKRDCELPINPYAFSKLQFDQFARNLIARGERPVQLAGLRYFNVYGVGEAHKDSMASTAWHFSQQIAQSGVAKLFGEYDGFAPGMHKRDFVSVEDCVAINLWLFDHPSVSGIFNCGTGMARSFFDMYSAVAAALGRGQYEFMPFPDHLKGAYQSFTEADMTLLRGVGCEHSFLSLEEGVARYVTSIQG